ncbi:asparagine synthase [Lentzea sp. NBRC 105346]|uniref:asparagine synthase-related protein n=1 Tax=Lentzea sp. NBRC 105346 TaxID=3032205 RepID=UPI00249F9F4A|nr:asparagine synthase-related protein [Lentzea sp. NBRC 105346]GLZ31281.1 asparagine synthase [Lentzea sp. NBRC 105346]
MTESLDWFVAVADGDREAHAVRGFLARAPQRIDHPSGRPWLLGRWADDRLVRVTERGVQIAVLGVTSVTASALRGRSLDEIAGLLRGEWHLVAAVDGCLSVRGMVSGLRRVSYSLIDGVPVAADRDDLLASDGVDPAVVAVQLLTRGAGQLGDVPAWRGVRRVPPDSVLHTRPGGGHRVERWWTPPAPERSLAEGVPLVRGALRYAVAARLAPSMSADLSGGMDSTSICFLLDAYRPGEFVTQVMSAPDADFDDVEWAGRAAAYLNSKHQVLDVGELPSAFGGFDAVWTDLEQPHGWIRNRWRLQDQAVRMAAAGSVAHFTGAGGDELFRPWVHHLHTLVRTRPWQALRSVRAYRRFARWPLGQIVRALADRRSYRANVLDAIAGIGTPERASGVLDMSWVAPLHLPPWATPLAAELAADQLRSVDEPEPLGRDRAAHTMLEGVRTCAANARLTDRLMRRFGVRTATPFLDDRVVEAVLSVRQSDHAGPVRYKPLLAAAMRGIVPDDVLGRRTKGEFSSEVHLGLRRNRAAIARLFEDSELARLGLIDPAGVRDVLVGVHRDNLGVIALESTLACEVWLREVATRTARVVR